MVVAAIVAADVQFAHSAGPATRAFHLGFTRWPADLTAEGVQTAVNFANDHGDVIAVTFMGGIPWPEAHDDKPFSKDVETNLAYRSPPNKRIFLSISPLDAERKGLAPYWGERDNQPLPAEWKHRALDSPEVKKAFLNFCIRSVDALRPDWLAIGVESNVLLSRDRIKWGQLKALHRETYRALKQRYPRLPVFFTTDVLHYKKLAADARTSDQEGEVADLMKASDVFAMSVYPYMSNDTPRPTPHNFFDFARGFHKPLAISESGMTSRDIPLKAFNTTLRGSEAEQFQFTQLILQTAARDKYLFVINFATTDFERLCNRLKPPVDDLARIWAFTGMQTDDRKPKPALAVWDAYLNAKHIRHDD